MKRKNRTSAKRDEAASLAPAFTMLYCLSGFCILALETLWMHEVSLWAGNTVVATTLVVAVFFLSAALGNWIGSYVVQQRRNSLDLYGCLEIAAAATAALTFLAGRWVWAHLSAWPLEQVTITLLLVGPPSLLSGFAFPILTEALVSSPQLRTIKAGPLYGANLLGAALGVISGGVLLPWWLGLKISFGLVLFLQAVGGAFAWRIASLAKPEAFHEKKAVTNLQKPEAPGFGLAVLALSGLLSLAAQVLLIQWARQVLQGSVFVLTAVLAVFIGGLGLGALLAAALRRRGHDSLKLLTIFAGLGALLLFAVPPLGRWLVGFPLSLGNHGPAGLLGEALGWCTLTLLPLTICLGAVFPLAWELAGSGQPHQGTVLGRMLALNKTAAGVGAAFSVFVLLPGLGLIGGTNALAWSYAAISVAALLYSRRNLWLFEAAVIMTGLGIWLGTLYWPALGLTAGEKLIADDSGVYGPVSVIEMPKSGSRQILLNSRLHLSGTKHAMSSQWHQGWVPLLFCRNPERVMTIGMAAGISANATLDFPIKELTAVELVPEVVQAARDNFGEWNHALFADTRAKVIIGDGRVLLPRTPGKFDAIICDLFFPAEDATANLYSRDFFRHAKDHLQPGGLFCLWLPCYQHDEQSAGIVIRTFLDVFPNAVAVRANLDPEQPVIGLLGSTEPIPVSHEFLQTRLASLAGTTIPQRSPFFRSPENAALLFAGDLRAANPGFDAYPVTTDDHPLFSFIGPREPQPGRRLVGIPFLNWIGRRFLEPRFPSCDVADSPPQDLLASMRAANYYFAAAVAISVVPGDTRPPEVRDTQINSGLQHARLLRPQAELPEDALGR